MLRPASPPCRPLGVTVRVGLRAVCAQILLYSLNFYINMRVLKVTDAGGSMIIHSTRARACTHTRARPLLHCCGWRALSAQRSGRTLASRRRGHSRSTVAEPRRCDMSPLLLLRVHHAPTVLRRATVCMCVAQEVPAALSGNGASMVSDVTAMIGERRQRTVLSLAVVLTRSPPQPTSCARQARCSCGSCGRRSMP
jgi:hypothetical protein